MLRINVILDGFKKELRHGADDYVNYFGNIESYLERDDLARCIDMFCEIVSWENFSDFNDLIAYVNGDNRYFDDRVSEQADGGVNIYYYEIRKWFVDHSGWVDQAADEFGTDNKNFDIHKLIQMGEYLMLQTGVYNVRDYFVTYVTEKYKF